jgi:uncharacterized protein (DUF1330 family)
MPKGYLIAELEVTNPAGFEQYRREVLAAYGARYVVRGGDATQLEGPSGPVGRMVVVEFDSVERLMAFYYSPEYQAILPSRLNNSTGRVFCVAGAE